ncbi:MAG: type II CAAX endopeptidase family protein [Candidatus Thiodiazotropha sp. DIVDIV]
MTNNFNYKGKNYFQMVFIGTFLLWGVGGFMSFSPDWMDYFMLPMLIGLMMPAIVAIGFIWFQPESGIKRDFTQRLLNIRLVRPVVFLLSLCLMPLSVVLSILISLAFDGSIEQFQVSEAFSFSSGFVPVLLLLFVAAVFEELGWRGYGFESLEKGRSFLAASLIFGVIWSLWHLPLLWVNHSYQYEIYQQSPWYAVNFYLGTAVLGVIISWVCHINQRSILVAILFHFIVNLSQEMLSMTQQTKSIQTFVLIGFAVVIVMNQWSLFRRQGVVDRNSGNALSAP